MSANSTEKQKPGNERLLRGALLFNAVFSASSAFVLVFLTRWFAELSGCDHTSVLRIVGVGLVLFAAALFWQSTRSRLVIWHAFATSVADFLWVIGSFLLYLLIPGSFSETGWTIVAGVAAIVFLAATLQLKGIQACCQTSSRDYYLCIPVEADVRVSPFWTILADLGEISRYSDHLADSSISMNAGKMIGSVRTCHSIDGKVWSEECTAFVQNERVEVRFLTDRPDFPFPVKNMSGGWHLEEISDAKTLVSIYFNFELKRDWLASFLLPLMSLQLEFAMPKTVDQMVRAASGEGKAPSKREHMARIFPHPC